MKNLRPARVCLLYGLAVCSLFAGAVPSAFAAFHLWQVREVFTNASGSVQFVEMFDSFAGETLTNGLSLTASSDGVIKTFKFPSNLAHPAPGALLIATTGFGDLPGAVTPDFTFDQSSTPFSGSFFNPSATSITISFSGSGDSMTFTGASLPKDGINSLTDSGAVGFPPGTPNIGPGVNSPTNLLGNSGGINQSSGDYNGSHLVDAADYAVWRKNPAAFGANLAGFSAWRSNFGNAAGFGSGGGIPEPATEILLFFGFICAKLMFRAGHRSQHRLRHLQ